MKKYWLMILIAILTVTFAVTLALAQDGPSGVVRVATWESGDALEPWNNAIAAFEAAFPNIDIQLEPVPQEYGTRLLAQFAAGNAPDIYQVGDGDVASRVANGVAMPLDPFIEGENGIDMSIFFPAIAAFGQVDGTTYLLTKEYSPLVLYYNKDIFDEAGIPYPTPDWTWDDFLAIAQALTVDGNGNNATSPDFDPNNIVRWGIQLPGTWGDWLWHRGIQPIIEQNGGSFISEDGTTVTGYLNSEETVAALQWYVDLFLTHHVAPTRDDVDAFAGSDLFQSGLVAMVWTGRWPLKDYLANPELNFGTMGLPAGPAGNGNVLCWAGFAINAQTQNPEAAWEFLRYIAAGDGAREFANYGLSAVQPIIEEQGLDEDEFNGPIVADLANVKPIPESRTEFFNECVLDPFRLNLERVFLEGLDVQTAMDQAAADADACLASK